ncbi:MAG TPA: YkgJ family cysteine cluster protein [Stellaceae bacterium]|jgi:Fe-S-cluster containining protein
MESLARPRIDDVGLRMPKGLPAEVAQPFAAHVAAKTMALRSQAMAQAGPDVAVGNNPWLRLKFVLDIIATSIVPEAEHTIADFAAEADIQCRAGCSFCCHQNVDVTIPEAILVALRLAKDDAPRAAAVLEAADLFKDLDDEQRVATGRPCPLLVDDRCSIYAVRPITCRSCTSPDAKRCEEAKRLAEAGEQTLAIEIYVVLQFLCSGEQTAIRGICRDLGLQADIVELTQTVAAILRNPQLVERWAAGERVFTAR